MAKQTLCIVLALSLLALPALAQDAAVPLSTEDAQPASVVELFYNLYAAVMRFSLDNGLARDGLPEWGVDWSAFLSEDLLASLDERLKSDEPLPADPVLCAQDVPSHITTEHIKQELSSGVFVLVRGEYPSGPGATTTTDLAEVKLLPTADGVWQILEITCAP